MEPGATAPGVLCAICQCEIEPGEATHPCPECRATYHGDCWAENGGCAVYGCPCVPETEKREDVEIPASYWGQEDKRCPSCGGTILAAARRCRHCGAEFATARQLHRVEYSREQARKARAPGVRNGVILLVAASLLSCTAPVALVAGFLWYRSVQEDLEKMPGLYAGLSKVALIVAAVQTVTIMAMTLAYGVFRA